MRRAVRLIAAVTCLSAAAFGQAVAGMGGLSGIVRDASGASVPSARVVVANESRGIRRTLQTNAAGIFSAPALPPARRYSVTVNAEGFAAFQQEEIEILVGQNIDLSITLAVASAATQVRLLF